MRSTQEGKYFAACERHKEKAENLREQIEALRSEASKLRLLRIDQSGGNAPGDPDETRSKLDQLHDQLVQLEAEERAETDKFHKYLFGSHRFYLRPTLGFAGLLSKPLGPHPWMMHVIDADVEALAEARSYRISGFVLFVCAIACLLGMILVCPWLGKSPALLVYASLSHVVPLWSAGVLTVIAGYWFIKLLTSPAESVKPHGGKFFDRNAMYEEQWFRSGAENWSKKQRLYSCVAFGAVHFANYIYSFASLIVIAGVGAVFLAVYLREYRRSGDYRNATIAAAKLHAAFNRYVLGYFVVAIVVLICTFIW